MKAICIHNFGPTEDVLQYEDIPVPVDLIGGEVYQKSLQVLAPGGRLVSIGGAFGPVPDPPPALTEGRKATRFSITNYLKAKPEDFKQLDAILKLVQEKEFDRESARVFRSPKPVRHSVISKAVIISAKLCSRCRKLLREGTEGKRS